MNKDQVRLTVVIPGYRTPSQWWIRCVFSVLDSIGYNDEVICIDDGTPGGVPVLSDIAKNDSRVRVLIKENGGLSSARNLGIDMANGKYITFVDSDDEVIPGCYNKCIKQMKEENSEIAIYGVRTIWPKLKLQKEDCLPTKNIKRVRGVDVKDLSDAYLFNYACNKIYLRSFLNCENQHKKKIRFFLDGMPCEDVIFNIDCLMAGAQWCVIGEVGYIYYRTQNTLLSSYKPSNFKGIIACAQAWELCSKHLDMCNDPWFVKRAVIIDKDMKKMEWNNIWMPDSPYTIVDKWVWLKKNTEVGGVVEFFKKMVYSLLRTYFYFNFVRSWHIKRLYPEVESVGDL
jgi:glycosyltransferase involved in cell wall biosynthesis